MKNLKIFLLALLMFVQMLSAQINSLPSASKVSGEYDNEEVLEFYEPDIDSFQDYSKPTTSLNIPITVSFTNRNLSQIIKSIAKAYKVNFIFEDKLLNIAGISYKAENKPLHVVLDELLDPFDVSYYEFEADKIALAKRTRIDEKTGIVKGIIKDETGTPLYGASVLIKELKIGCATDTKGNYIIKNIRPGDYTLEVSFVGYEKATRKIKVVARLVVDLTFTLKASTFLIGGMVVTGQVDLLPKDVSTKTTIQSGEIEHYQASSLKDVLDLVPGVQKTDNPGLGKTSQITVRGDEGDGLSAFGTLVIVDGVPVSNNANLQFEKLSGSKFGGSNMGGGADLRMIPADNIESIEVITGLPSVRYGDVSAGVINVQTKIGASPNRLKLKNNPDTREGNLGGGFLIGDNGLSYNLNVAQSERDIRKTGDEYLRLTGQAVFSSNYFDDALSMNNKFNFQKIFDEEEPKGDVQQTKNYNRGFQLGYTVWGKYKPVDLLSSWDYNAFVTMRRENTMKSGLKQSDLRILPNGDTVSTYLGKVETKGIEWTVGSRLEWNNVFYTGDIIHKVMIGADPQYNANTGQGVIFDTLFSYYGVESGRRPYSFDDIPGQFLLNFYAEDKMTGHLFFDYNIMLGCRYEMYRPYKFNLKGLLGDGDLVNSHQGTYFNPRASVMIYLSETNQIRLSAGITSKSPPMSNIYPPESVVPFRNPYDSTTTYFRYDKRVPELKAYREKQFEFSYDQKFFNMIGTSFSAYYKKRLNEPESQTVPVFFSTTYNNHLYVFYTDNYSIYQNLGWTESKGLEFSLKTNKVKPLNMEFQVVGSYNFLKSGRSGYSFGSTPDTALGQYPNYPIPNIPIDTVLGWTYDPGGKWSDRFQINYYVKYTIASLGLWVTVRAEQLAWERSQSTGGAPQDFSKLNETQKISYLFDREIKKKPNKWLFNINVSKSLFPGGEVSFYVNNFLDDPAVRTYYRTPTIQDQDSRNPALTYGIEFSFIVDKLFGRD
ncbi:MAG: TonB-dependent receptor [Ignavibacteria bacterium]|nr:TonB-dependent receptor [Ignavibacteria bacterium]